ncbi:uncharacterized protein LOC110974844 [Acanthaster planci]|uniref:Uncharacterized protein LOC110974844 n=1 Tax=Acanthaster planci TaxID=133434 RepID=A0A8B7XNP7_ACAPL|nr:uncharacterized protein LOC110974844 [Acanthaster planci]
MHVCSVIKCRHRSRLPEGRQRNKDVSFYRLPSVLKHQGAKTEELSRRRRARWLTNICRDDLLAKEAAQTSTLIHLRVCSDHFVGGKPSALYDRRSPDWAPTLNLGHSNPVVGEMDNLDNFVPRDELPNYGSIQTPSGPAVMEKGQCLTAPMLYMYGQNELTAHHSLHFEHSHHHADNLVRAARPEVMRVDMPVPGMPISESIKKEVRCQTDLTQRQMRLNEEDMMTLRGELYQLRQNAACSLLDELAFQNDDGKVRFYTGLPCFGLLLAFFDFVVPHVARSHRNALTPFSEFVMVLMRLRRNLPLQDLAYRFNVSTATASRLFERWIDTMDIRFSHLIMFPDKDLMDSCIAKEFATALGNHRNLIFVHCIELHVDWPRCWVKRSNRKNPEEVKFLIGLSPCGLIGFVSKVWIGKEAPNDQMGLIKQSGLVDLLHCNDIVLSTPDFDFSQSGLYAAKVTPPDISDGTKRLCAINLSEDSAKRIAGIVRVQTEGVIRSLRQKYQILEGRLQVELVKRRNGRIDSHMDKIVRVCCSLINTCAAKSPQCLAVMHVT